ncbi:MAG: virulence RhuM family protein [Ruminococcus sp.]|nr:virulence RhuM family protein [Ruminococcus sp.]MBR2304948.1 virulence RhuM family protein [Ruminococcus sp.]
MLTEKYFDQLLERIREIRLSERRFYQKITDIYATAVDYDKKRYPGKPDIILPKYKTAVYINGCFWHMHDCENFVWPKSNTKYWTNKLINNKNRDIKYHDQMKEKGWKVIVVWECEINDNRLEYLIKEIRDLENRI